MCKVGGKLRKVYSLSLKSLSLFGTDIGEQQLQEQLYCMDIIQTMESGNANWDIQTKSLLPWQRCIRAYNSNFSILLWQKSYVLNLFNNSSSVKPAKTGKNMVKTALGITKAGNLNWHARMSPNTCTCRKKLAEPFTMLYTMYERIW